MNDGTLVVASASTEAHKMKLCEKKSDAFKRMHNLAEVVEGELDLANECEDMQYMLAKVLRYGTWHDAAVALATYVTYAHANEQLAEI